MFFFGLIPYLRCTRPQNMQFKNIVLSCCTYLCYVRLLCVQRLSSGQHVTHCHPGGEAVGAENYGSNAAYYLPLCIPTYFTNIIILFY